jgi:bacterioferritin-associated ferredoxin
VAKPRIIDKNDMTFPRTCDACDASSPVVVQVGRDEFAKIDTEENLDSIGCADMCPKCLRAAVALLDEYESGCPAREGDGKSGAKCELPWGHSGPHAVMSRFEANKPKVAPLNWPTYNPDFDLPPDGGHF